MVSSIQFQKQKIKRRKPPKPIRVRSRNPLSITGISERFNLYRLKRRLKTWMKGHGRLSWFTAAGLSVILTGVFLSSSVPSSGSTLMDNSLPFPREAEITDMLLDYLEFDETYEDQEISIPEGTLLDATQPEVYTLSEGDTLSELAENYKVSLGTLISYNGIQDVRRIQSGTAIRIPKVDGVVYRVRRGDNLSSIADRHNVPLNDILDANDLETSVIRSGQELFIPGAALSNFDLKKALGELFVYPTRGRLSSPFGMRNDPFTGVLRMHYGIDIANLTGTAVNSSMDGTVLATGFSLRSYGNYVIIKHQGGYQSLYGHLETIEVSKGQRVRQGQRIGGMGNSGRSTGPHLHFAIYQYQNPVDPSKYLY